MAKSLLGCRSSPRLMWTVFFSTILFFSFARSLSLPVAGKIGVNCSLSNARLQVPTNQTQLIAPEISPGYIALGVGTQNYTCNSTFYVLEGAVAELFDSSCLYGTPSFDGAPVLAYAMWEALAGVTPQEVIAALGSSPDSLVLGQHTYVPSPTGKGLSPKWDFTSSTGNPNAYVIGAKVGDLPSPNPKDIDNLMVKAIAGDLASLIFRVQNNGGRAPTSCSTEGSNITVKYTAQYWFFGGNVSV